MTEITPLGTDVQVLHGGIAFSGRLPEVYRANLSLRSGNRVLLRLGEFLAQNYPMLYNRARKLDWLAILGNCQELAIRVSSRKSRLSNQERIRRAVWDAISSSLGRHGLGAEERDVAKLTIYVRLFQDRCTVSLDTSGEHLHRRGYRKFTSDAPLRETSAAALLLAMDSASYDLVLDPFCGTGTFLAEAALVARNYPPGAHRSFAIEHSPLHSATTLRYVKRKLLESAKPSPSQTIMGSDISAPTVGMARANLANVAASDVHLSVGNALELDYAQIGAGRRRKLLVANLPYGRRLGTPDTAKQLAIAFMEALARNAKGWDVCLVAPPSFDKVLSQLPATRVLDFTNGGLPVRATAARIR